MAVGALTLCVATFLLASLLVEGYTPNTPMETFTIDLDLPPSQRWIHILGHYNDTVPAMIKYFKDEFTELERIIVHKVLPSIDEIFGKEYSEELRSIASYWKMDLGLIVGLNIMYETRKLLGAHFNTTPNGTAPNPPQVFGCVSIITQDCKGNIIHGRNLDWILPNDMRNISFMLDFVSNGSLLFTGLAFPGMIGIPTGISKRGFSFSLNERSLGGSVIGDSIDALLLGGREVVLYGRQVLTTATSYEEAVSMLSKKYLAAPVYYIVAGSRPNQGAVVTRDRNILTNLWQLDVSRGVSNSSWYLLETNYDHWKPVDPYDDRRDYGLKYLNELGQNRGASMAGVLDVLLSWPLRNPFTTQTIVMHPAGFVILSFQEFNVTEQSPLKQN